MNGVEHEQCVLATDLDGTLIPLPDEPENQTDLRRLQDDLQSARLQLVFVTGRHLESVLAAIPQYELPLPQWIICDVGTTLVEVVAAQDEGPTPGSLQPFAPYQQHLRQLVGSWTVERLSERLQSISGLRKQELEKQGPFKLSYYAAAEDLPALTARVEQLLSVEGLPYRVIASIDPFNNDGLVDLLPHGVSKAYALQWWAQLQRIPQTAILFAGDSGNDLAALCAGYRSIIVANAAISVIGKVQTHHQQQGWGDRLFVATQAATSGVREGLRHYLGSVQQ